MTPKRFVVALAALLAVLVVAGVLAFALDRSSPHEAGASSNPRAFTIVCTWSHRAADDPIVHPGHPGAAHLHDFFGSTAAGADPDPVALLGTPSTCQTSADTAAYWLPTLFDGEEVVEPGRLFAYYRLPEFAAATPQDVQPYPFGLAMVAGDADATAPQPVDVVAWHCGASPDHAATPVSCPSDAPLALWVRFPSCWDGSVERGDEAAHVVYGSAAGCPHSHPNVLPELVMDVVYEFAGEPSGLRLSSGPTVTAHADFLNAWDPQELARRVHACLQDGECGLPVRRAVE